MTSKQFQQRLDEVGLVAEPLHYSRADLIRLVQLREGLEPCYRSDKRYGCTEVCEWRSDCQALRAHWRA